LVTALQDPTGVWQEMEPPVNESAGPPISESAAHALRDALPRYQDVWEYGRLVLSGPENTTNGWYLGFTNRYVVVVVVEGSDDLVNVATIGRGMMTAVLNPRNLRPVLRYTPGSQENQASVETGLASTFNQLN